MLPLWSTTAIIVATYCSFIKPIWRLENLILFTNILYPYSELLTKDQKRVFRKKAANYEVIRDKLFRISLSNQLLVVQASELGCILKEIHDNAGHQCVRYSFHIEKYHYYWLSM